MHQKNLKQLFRIPLRSALIGIVTVILSFSAERSFGDDREILDQLYREILNSSDMPFKLGDSAGRGDVPKEQIPSDNKCTPPSLGKVKVAPSDEKLRQEIEKMIEDAAVRHSEAVKFMQDSK